MASEKAATVRATSVSVCAPESMARQPEVAGTIQTGALILAALVEGVALFAVVVTLLISLKF